VTDSTGAVIAGASVKTTNALTGVVREVTSNGEGVYVITGIEPGTYSISAGATGFAPVQQDGISAHSTTAFDTKTTLCP
jgi:Carboxypeptidase regulatory-like domain